MVRIRESSEEVQKKENREGRSVSAAFNPVIIKFYLQEQALEELVQKTGAGIEFTVKLHMESARLGRIYCRTANGTHTL
jgi:hypothetical protein